MCLNSSTRSSCVQFSGIEVYARIVTACEVIALLDTTGLNRAVLSLFTKTLCEHLEIDKLLRALIPNEPSFATPMVTRSASGLACFRDTHARLLDARPALLPWLLIQTYAAYPPTAPEAFRFLKLQDIQHLLDSLGRLLQEGPIYIPKYSYKSHTEEYIENQETKINFFLDQLVHYGIDAENYSDAVKQYVSMLDSVFPQRSKTAARPHDSTVHVRPVLAQR